MIIRMSDGRELPVEMHSVRIMQNTSLLPISRREAIAEAGHSVFFLHQRTVLVVSTSPIELAMDRLKWLLGKWGLTGCGLRPSRLSCARVPADH